MTVTEGFILFFAGLIVFAAAGILLARQLISSLFSLGLLLLGVAGIYGSLHMEAALLAQLVLYIGGIMVLIGFALQIYPASPGVPAFSEIRESFGKGLLLLIAMLLCIAFAPWKALMQWQQSLNATEINPQNLQLKEAGRYFLLKYPLEFEWLGVLILAVLLMAGWYLKENYPENKV